MKKITLTATILAVLVAAPAAWAQDDTVLMLDNLNVSLAGLGENVQVEMIEWITAPDAPELGRTVYASNRGNKELSSHWVPYDPNRGGVRYITYINDLTEGATASGLTAAQTDAAIGRAMQTWEDQTCSEIPLVDLGSYDFDFGYVQYLLGYGGVPGWAADLTQAGWLPKAFFNAIAPGGGNFILGATFTFIWTDGNGPTDQDNNGRNDTAFREVYYNNAFPWAIDANYDVETVVLHEAGHGLSQGHFGDIFRDGAGGLHFAPRAVMNAAYSGVQQELTGTDIGGHCTNWGSWPNN